MKRAPGGAAVYRFGIAGITLRVADRAHPVGRRGVAMRMNLLPGRAHWLLALALSLTAACGTAPAAESPAREDIFRAAGPNEFILLTARGELVSADIEPGTRRRPGREPRRVRRRQGARRADSPGRGVRPGRERHRDGPARGRHRRRHAAGLSVTRAEAGLRARGLLAGALSDYRLDERQLTGTIGRCKLRAQAGRGAPTRGRGAAKAGLITRPSSCPAGCPRGATPRSQPASGCSLAPERAAALPRRVANDRSRSGC